MAKNIISEIIELDRQADLKIDEGSKKSEQNLHLYLKILLKFARK